MAQALSDILMVEDDQDIQLIAKLALETIGKFNIEICNNGIEALEKLKEFKPQLILLDVMMPKMDGPTTLKKIRNELQLTHIPIIFMTAKVQKSEIEEYLEIGASEVITKPFDPMSLPEKLKEVYEAFHSK